MKKVLLCIAMAFFGNQFVQSQTVVQGTSNMNGGGDFRYGAKAAFLVSNLLGDGLVDNSSKPGFQVGGVLEIPIMDEFYFAPELLISLQGAGGVSDNLRFLYLNVPLMGKYYITEDIALELGPQLGLLLSDNTEDFNLTSNSIDVGVGAGGGYRLDDNFYFQLRINLGFIKVIENVKAYNAALQVGAIYYF